MKQFFNILFLFISTFLFAITHTIGQDLPMVCAGSVSTYGVLGTGGSTFVWTITDPNGNPIPQKYIIVNNDKVEVTWRDTLPAGMYTFSVLETTVFGCTGTLKEPQHIILNNNTISMPFVGVPTSVAACIGNEVTLDPGLFHNYFWTINSSTSRTYITTEAGTYEVRLVDENQSCTYNDIEAVFHPLPYVWLGNDTTLFASQTLELNVFDPDFTAYQWFSNGVDMNLNTLTSAITVDGLSGTKTYKVEVTDENGCENSDEIKVTAGDLGDLDIPAAFTPNGDEINDKWDFPRPKKQFETNDLYQYFNNDQIKVTTKVFNRWGKLVWESDIYKSWDGKDLNGRELPMDSYHYIIVISFKGKEFTYKGSVTIIR